MGWTCKCIQNSGGEMCWKTVSWMKKEETVGNIKMDRRWLTFGRSLDLILAV